MLERLRIEFDRLPSWARIPLGAAAMAGAFALTEEFQERTGLGAVVERAWEPVLQPPVYHIKQGMKRARKTPVDVKNLELADPFAYRV